MIRHPASIGNLLNIKPIIGLSDGKLDVFDKVIEKCGGEGYKHEETFKVESESFDFFIRLKPVQDDYSHLFVYAK